MRTKWWAALSIMVALGASIFAIAHSGLEYAYIPARSKVLAPEVTVEQVAPAHGIDEATVNLGRRAFYGETFGNEVFLTDIAGVLDGPLNIWSIGKALLRLRGRGTTNLQIETPKTVTIGGRVFRAGEKVDTGLDVPRGAWVPLGMPIKLADGRIKVGICCVACHATVDQRTGKVIEGAPNRDLHAGVLLALATNSAAYFTHTDVNPLEPHLRSKGPPSHLVRRGHRAPARSQGT